MITITVKSCAECPFFVQTTLSFIAAILPGIADKAGAKFLGECNAPKESGRMHFPLGEVGDAAEKAREVKFRRLRVFDGETLPSQCPLRTSDITVSVGS